jgi:hypothetical protein
MTTLTVHALDTTLSHKLKAYAVEQQKSLNQSVKELLAVALGITSPRKKDHRGEFIDLCGVWSDKEVREFQKNTACFSEIEEGMWK